MCDLDIIHIVGFKKIISIIHLLGPYGKIVGHNLMFFYLVAIHVIPMVDAALIGQL